MAESDKNKDGCYGSCLMYIKGVCGEYERRGKKECMVSMS